MEPASAPLAELAPRYAFNERTARVITESLTPADWARRPPAGGNSAHWVLGHLCASRRGLLRMLGEALADEPWEAPFRRGASPTEDEAAGYPGPERLLEDLEASGRALAERLAHLRGAELEADIGRKLPDGSATRAGAAHFLYFHEVYHLGQLGLLRRLAGQPGFV